MAGSTGRGRVIAARYRLDRCLGAGGMGAVWLAHDAVLDRQVAIKEVWLPAELPGQEALRERTMREARSAARISHPNVVRIFDVVEADGPWIVMEYVPARTHARPGDPRRRPAAGRPGGADRPADSRRPAGRARGRRAASRRQAGNVLLDADGRVVLTDFGIASLEGDPSLTGAGLALGAPAYLAPERALGGPESPKSDLWSLGATLYAAVEGQPPYVRDGALPTMVALLTEDPTHRRAPTGSGRCCRRCCAGIPRRARTPPKPNGCCEPPMWDV